MIKLLFHKNLSYYLRAGLGSKGRYLSFMVGVPASVAIISFIFRLDFLSIKIEVVLTLMAVISGFLITSMIPFFNKDDMLFKSDSSGESKKKYDVTVISESLNKTENLNEDVKTVYNLAFTEIALALYFSFISFALVVLYFLASFIKDFALLRFDSWAVYLIAEFLMLLIHCLFLGINSLVLIFMIAFLRDANVLMIPKDKQ